MDGWRRGATCVSSHHLCLRAGGRQRQQEVGVPRGLVADFQREEDPCSVPVLSESVTVSSAKVSAAPIMAFQSSDSSSESAGTFGGEGTKRKRGNKN